MDIVYPLGNGSIAKNIELKYSLRSLSMLNNNIGNVIIIGSKPGWLINASYIKLIDRFNNKQSNVIRKLLYICNLDDVSDSFLLMNDDFFFLTSQAIQSYLRNINLVEQYNLQYKNNPKARYTEAMINTINYLKSKDQSINNYEVHYPMIFNKKKLKEVLSDISWIDEPVLYRSLYGNSFKINGERRKDFKIYNEDGIDNLISNPQPFLSIDNRVARSIKFTMFIKKCFPIKSKYEL